MIYMFTTNVSMCGRGEIQEGSNAINRIVNSDSLSRRSEVPKVDGFQRGAVNCFSEEISRD